MGNLQAFKKKINFRRFWPFYIEKHSFCPKTYTICFSSMKFAMHLHYGNASAPQGCFLENSEKIHSPLKKKTSKNILKWAIFVVRLEHFAVVLRQLNLV